MLAQRTGQELPAHAEAPVVPGRCCDVLIRWVHQVWVATGAMLAVAKAVPAAASRQHVPALDLPAALNAAQMQTPSSFAWSLL